MTPAVRILDAAGIDYRIHEYVHEGEGDYGLEAARGLGLDPDRVFKTLLVSCQGAGSSEIVAVVPVSSRLGLKAISTVVGAKRAEMCDPDRAQRLTGYVVGGISPIGQKKALPTIVDQSADSWPTIFVSGGRRGLDLEIAPDDLVAVCRARRAPIAVRPQS